MKKRVFALLLTALMLSGCTSGKEETPVAEVSPETSVTQEEEPGKEEEETASVESQDLLLFSATMTDPAGAQNAGYSFYLRKRTDPSEADLKVTVIPLAEGYEPVSTEAVIDSEALNRLQETVVSLDLIGGYCQNGAPLTPPEETYTQEPLSHMQLIYASGEEAYHESIGTCAVDEKTQLALRDFFYSLLEEEGIRFYGMDNVYDDEEYLDAFLSQAPFDPYIAPDGTELKLSFGEGRVFLLEINGETASGNYKRRVQTQEGSRGTDTLTITLTMWPVDWEQMMNGGSFVVDHLTVEKGTEPGTGTESVTILKNGTAMSLFDPYYSEEGTIVFSRNYTGWFEETPAEEEPDEEGTESVDEEMQEGEEPSTDG